MRDAFVEALLEVADKDERLALLMAEVGYGVVEPFQRKYPDRFFNVGICEQNLVLNAAGLAIEGFHPVAYSMSSFLPTRAFEMIKDSICYQNLPVILVGIGSGVSYGELGSTHHAIEEEALMRSLPNLTVIFPSSADECKAALKYANTLNKPVYIGLEKIKSIPTNNTDPFSPSWKMIGTGTDGVIIAVGTMYEVAKKTKDILKKEGKDIAIVRAEVVKPIDYNTIDRALDAKNIFVLDEHVSVGSVGESIATYALESGQGSKISHFEIISIKDEFPDKVYNMKDLYDRYGFISEKLYEKIKAVMD